MNRRSFHNRTASQSYRTNASPMLHLTPASLPMTDTWTCLLPAPRGSQLPAGAHGKKSGTWSGGNAGEQSLRRRKKNTKMTRSPASAQACSTITYKLSSVNELYDTPSSYTSLYQGYAKNEKNVWTPCVTPVESNSRVNVSDLKSWPQVWPTEHLDLNDWPRFCARCASAARRLSGKKR